MFRKPSFMGNIIKKRKFFMVDFGFTEGYRNTSSTKKQEKFTFFY